jgi:chloramphenicol 3-O-phosphotransferase
MFVLINGAFGVGKTSVARELRRLVPGSVIYDPEPVGVVLQQVHRRPVSDFQDLALWRRLTVTAARALAAVRSPVIIPMAFSNADYLNEIRAGLAMSGQPVLHFCLTAPLDVLRERLTRRGEPLGEPRWAWVHRRAEECCSAHEDALFATHVSTDSRPPSAVAADLAERITSPSFFGPGPWS